MKILIVNTSELTGGAAVAANRLAKALENCGVEVKMMVRQKQTEAQNVVSVGSKTGNFLRFCRERLVIFLNNLLSRRNLFAVSIANTGIDITQTPEFREADVIHLHWINQGMLSLKGIRKILDTGKPVVWTMHDMWPATAICHYAHECNHYETECRNCPFLRFPGRRDLANRVWQRKKKMMATRHLSFVTCSQWLGRQVRQSVLLKGQQLTSIPNAIDTLVFRHYDKATARTTLKLPLDKSLILFVSQRITDTRKGISYLIEAVGKLAEKHPEMKENSAIVVLGGHSEELTTQFPLPVYPMGYVTDPQRIVDVYNAADVFVLPSLSDNLPNTIMEAMACGVPCVGFEVGGIPEMIDHRENGYVAKFRNADDLAAGIHWVLHEADHDTLSRKAVGKVLANYSEESVANRYIELYRKILEEK